MSNIYNLPKEIESALAMYYSCFDLETGEIIVDQEILTHAEQRLNELSSSSEDIITRFVEYRANRLAHANALWKEVERITKLYEAEIKAVDKMDSLIDRAFDRIYQGKSRSFGTFVLGYRKSEAVVITDEAVLPPSYLKTPEPQLPKPDKAHIKEDLKSGIEIPGAIIEQRKNLFIK